MGYIESKTDDISIVFIEYYSMSNNPCSDYEPELETTSEGIDNDWEFKIPSRSYSYDDFCVVDENDDEILGHELVDMGLIPEEFYSVDYTAIKQKILKEMAND